jgi:hypothetical protein
MALELCVSPYCENGLDGIGRNDGDWDNSLYAMEQRGLYCA